MKLTVKKLNERCACGRQVEIRNYPGLPLVAACPIALERGQWTPNHTFRNLTEEEVKELENGAAVNRKKT